MTQARALFLALSLGLLGGCNANQVPSAQNYGTIQGRAYDSATNQGVAGVIVTVDAIDSATTAADGTYKIPNIPIGEYDLTAAAPSGYAVGAIPDASGSLVAGQSISVDVPLTKQ
ncbi:MAG: carboxypeptidase-like regulatory domain-containing protein [Vulcanimicrobiaceae bacterium]